MSATYDIVIVGGGIVGMTAALGLALKTNFKIALIDAQDFSSEWSPENKFDNRVSAISLASQRIFKKINVWDKIAIKRYTPYAHMFVWDELGAKIEFNAEHLNEPALGYIVEDNVMRASLNEAIKNLDQITLYPLATLKTLKIKPNIVELNTVDDIALTTKLLIGADGANSWVRSHAGIQLNEKNYDHTAIVTTVKTASPHQQTAWQRFIKTGPLAFLPLPDENLSSIVWSTLPSTANHLLTQDDESFKKSLCDAFAAKLGEIIAVDKRYHYPLKMRHAKNYVLDKIALIGDAAHTLHPLAGQGVNLGLLDAACLVDVITEAEHKKRDIASLYTLRKYERWRKGDNLAMLKMVEFLKSLFMSDQALIQSFRSVGLSFTDRVSFLKSLFANHALGNQVDLPELAKLFF